MYPIFSLSARYFYFIIKLFTGRKNCATGYVFPSAIPLSSCISFHLVWFFKKGTYGKYII